MNKVIIGLALLLAIVVSSCEKSPFYEGKHTLNNNMWTYDNPAVFQFEIKDTTKIYSLNLEVNHQADYKWENLYTQIETLLPSGKKEKQLVSLELANNFGQWEGTGSSDITLVLPLQERVRFVEQGSYQININQFMRRDSIPHINSIGVALVEKE